MINVSQTCGLPRITCYAGVRCSKCASLHGVSFYSRVKLRIVCAVEITSWRVYYSAKEPFKSSVCVLNECGCTTAEYCMDIEVIV